MSAFNNPEVIKMLQNEFIPVAIDGGLMGRRNDPEGDFYLKFSNTQARYAAAADGTSLAQKTWVPSPHLNKWMIEGASKPRPNLGPDDGDVKLDLRAEGVLRYDRAKQEITQFDLVVYGPYSKGGRPSEIGFHFHLTGDEAADGVPPWAVDRHHLYGDYPMYYTK